MKKLFSIVAAVLFAGSIMAVEVTKTVTELFPDVDDGTQEATLYNAGGLIISVNAKGNNGKVYDKAKDNRTWRLYQTADAVVTVALSQGTIKTVLFDFTVANTGTLNFGSTVMTSGTKVNVNAATAEFTVGNSGTATNGRIDIKGFTIVYDTDAEPIVPCEVEADGDFPFTASFVEVESSGLVTIWTTTTSEWIINPSLPEDDGFGILFRFYPKNDEKSMQGKYVIGESDVLSVTFEVKDGTPAIDFYQAKDGFFQILINDTEDGYDLNYEIVVEHEGNDVILDGTVYGICADIELPKGCRVTTDDTQFNWKVCELLEPTTEDKITLAAVNNINWLPESAGLGDGAIMTLDFTYTDRGDLRGSYNGVAGVLYVVQGEDKDQADIELETFEIRLNDQQESYDIYYKGIIKAGETEQYPLEGTIFAVCDDEIAIGMGIESTAATTIKGNKVLRNGHLFIQHEGRLYNATGAQVK